jgi:hypothetical protein
MPVQSARSGACRARGKLNAGILIGMLCPVAALGATVEESSASMFSLHGFGTVDAVYADARDADFVGNPFQPNGAGYTRAWAQSVDSKAGLQLGARLTSQLSAVVQVVSQLRYDDTWTPQIEWANVKYQLAPDFSIRVGRTVAAAFMLSDTRLVAYTYPWIRPPSELYGMLPVTNMDGMDANYRLHTGAVSHSLSVAYGQTNLKFAAGGELNARHFLEASDVMEMGSLTVRIGFTSLRIVTDIPEFETLFSGFTQFGAAASGFGFPTPGAQATALGTYYSAKGASQYSYSLATVGANYDPGNWLLTGEWAKSTSAGLLVGGTGWYLTGGYQFGQFTPYLTVGRVDVRRTIDPGISTAGLPPPLAEAAAALNGGLDAVLGAFAPSQSSASAGVRWDFIKNVDLKLQYDRVRLNSNTGGRLQNVQPGFNPDDQVNVVSVAVDFVF